MLASKILLYQGDLLGIFQQGVAVCLNDQMRWLQVRSAVTTLTSLSSHTTCCAPCSPRRPADPGYSLPLTSGVTRCATVHARFYVLTLNKNARTVKVVCGDTSTHSITITL